MTACLPARSDVLMQPPAAAAAHAESAAEHALRIVADLVVAELPLSSLVRTALPLNRTVSAAAAARLSKLLREEMAPLSAAPFGLERRQLLSHTALFLERRDVTDLHFERLGAALAIGALPQLANPYSTSGPTKSVMPACLPSPPRLAAGRWQT